jgi:3-oxo-5-alpha-steroid 4-dehydrogenase 1
MYVNIRSDSIIRNLRKPGDTKHYLPKGGMYNYVTSANYFGELTEWLGWSILTWSWAGLIFFWFTFANLVPRANSIYHRYEKEFAEEFPQRRLKRVFPFVY